MVERIMNFIWPNIKHFFLSLKIQLPVKLKRYCERQMLVILLFILFGDSFKWGNLFGITKYNWIQGHFSDIGLTAQFTTVIYYLLGHKLRGKYISIFLPVFAFTFFELNQYPDIDLVDILCYTLGSFIAFISIILYNYKVKKVSQ